MRWLLHGNLTPTVGDALRARGDTASTLADARITDDALDPQDLFKTIRQKQLDLITDNADLVNAVFENKIRFDRSIVFLQLQAGEVEQDDAIERLFKRYKRLTPARLYTVTGTRVKIRQLPGAG